MDNFNQNVVLFGVGWSAWTLFDLYLIQYSPWSELAVLAICALVTTAPRVRRAAERHLQKGREITHVALERV